jgi:hypothetical protein
MFGRFLKLKITQNRVYFSTELNTKLIRNLWKICEINVKYVGNIIYHVNIKKYDLINYKDHGCIYMHHIHVCMLLFN